MKKNPQDATLRNARAARRDIKKLQMLVRDLLARVRKLEKR